MLGTLALGACEDPEAGTDLRPEGDPEVLAVLVFNDTESQAVESATYCKENDPKRPGAVGIPNFGLNPIICPLDGSPVEPLTDAWPNNWYVRIMFDELLDPEVETLEPILDSSGNPTGNFMGSLARTQPVSLQCGDVAGRLVEVDYDGYYSPAGNRVSWPLGPSLVIRPLQPTSVPVLSRCQVTIKETVRDKSGNPVRGRDAMPFEFFIAPVTVIAFRPFSDNDDVVFPALTGGEAIEPGVGAITMDLNVKIDSTIKYCASPTEVGCVGDPSRIFKIEEVVPEGMVAEPVTGTYVNNTGDSLVIGGDLIGDRDYKIVFPEGFKTKDKCGKESEVSHPGEFEFSTRAARFLAITPGGGNTVAPARKIEITFSQKINTGSFVEGTDFTISPRPANFAVFPPMDTPTAKITLRGDYDLATEYTLTINKDAAIADYLGEQTITFSADRKATFRTIDAIAITSQTPADGAQVVRDGPVKITLAFNQDINLASLDTTEWSLTKEDGSPTGVAATASQDPEHPAEIVFTAALPVGDYKFVLKEGATLTDNINLAAKNVYRQAANREITFHVVDEVPAPAPKCLGIP